MSQHDTPPESSPYAAPADPASSNDSPGTNADHQPKLWSQLLFAAFWLFAVCPGSCLGACASYKNSEFLMGALLILFAASPAIAQIHLLVFYWRMWHSRQPQTRWPLIVCALVVQLTPVLFFLMIVA